MYFTIRGKEIIKPKYRGFIEDYNPNHGVHRSTWYQAKEYCEWLGKQIGVPLGLPTEAQWEYAARSRGLNVEHATDSGKIEGSYTEKRNYPVKDTIVGTYPPNPLGIYDMSGRIPEWTTDWAIRYKEGPLANPRYDDESFNSGEKMVRGWHKLTNSVYSRLGSRKPDNNGSGVGFRCVCNQETPIK